MAKQTRVYLAERFDETMIETEDLAEAYTAILSSYMVKPGGWAYIKVKGGHHVARFNTEHDGRTYVYYMDLPRLNKAAHGAAKLYLDC